MNDPVSDRVTEFAESFLPTLGLDLYDVQFRKEGHGWVLRLLIDKEGGVTLGDCSRVSREAGYFLDVEDFIGHPYHLEVSSPGAERALRSTEECRRFIGEKVRFKLNVEIEGERIFVGELHSVQEQNVTLTMAGKEITFAWETIKKARLTL